ncbi:MAG: hypothetical protein ABI760_21805 [Ferruginibacter sp.]
MKIRLLTLTSPDYYSFIVFLTELLSFTHTKGAPAGFTNYGGTIRASHENMPLFLKMDLICPSFPALQYTSETITGKVPKTHYLLKLNV